MSQESSQAPGLARVEGAARRGPFSSELLVGELSLCGTLGVAPVAQVMGACAYTIGVSGVPVLGDPGYREYFGRGSTSPAVLPCGYWTGPRLGRCT